MKISQLISAKKILIFGYGVEGKSTEKFFQSKEIVHYEIHDDGLDEFSDAKNFESFDIIVVSAGINRQTSLPDSVQSRCTSNTEIFFHNLNPKNRRKTIGITGTKGKSMTAKFAYELLQNCDKNVDLAGNYGSGLLDYLDKVDELDFLVMELSSFQLAFLDRSVHIAMCTNLYEDHLDWHGTVEEYHDHKANLWKYQTEADYLLVPYRYCDLPNFKTEGTRLTCGSMYHQFFPDSDSIWHAEHYLHNFGLVHELYRLLELPETAMKKTAQNLKALPHRMAHVGTINDIKFYDNVIATNPHATIADVSFLKNRLGSLILGGADRGNSFVPIFDAMRRNHVRCHIIVEDSESKPKILEALKEFPHLEYSESKDMEDTVRIALEITPPGKICLLSPACASWDKYGGYPEKGADFESCVKKQGGKL